MKARTYLAVRKLVSPILKILKPMVVIHNQFFAQDLTASLLSLITFIFWLSKYYEIGISVFGSCGSLPLLMRVEGLELKMKNYTNLNLQNWNFNVYDTSTSHLSCLRQTRCGEQSGRRSV